MLTNPTLVKNHKTDLCWQSPKGHREGPAGLSAYSFGTEARLQQDLCAGGWCFEVCCSSVNSRQSFSALKVVFDVEGELR